MNKRIDIYVDGKFVGTHSDPNIALNAILDEIGLICDDEGFDYPVIDEDTLYEMIEDIIEFGGDDSLYVDNTIYGVDTGEFVSFHIDLVGGIDRF